MRAWLWTCLLAVACALMLAAGCGGASGLPAWLQGGWVVVLADALGNPQEAFAFMVQSDGDAETSVQRVGVCHESGVLSMAFTGWSGEHVGAPLQLARDGTGVGTWVRTGAAPTDGAAAGTKAMPQGWSGDFALSTDGGAPIAVHVDPDGAFRWTGIGVGVVGPAGSLVVAFRNGLIGGPIVYTGVVSALGGAGAVRDRLGGTGAWTLVPAMVKGE